MMERHPQHVWNVDVALNKVRSGVIIGNQLVLERDQLIPRILCRVNSIGMVRKINIIKRC